MSEDIDHLDFVPEDPDLKRALESAGRILNDRRNFREHVDDLVDHRITSLLQEKGVIEAGEYDTFTREDLMDIARKAYFLGAREHMQKPEIFKEMLKAATESPTSTPNSTK